MLIDLCNNIYYHSIIKKCINVDYSALTERIETNPKASKLTVNQKVKITKYKNISNKGYTEGWS